MHNRTSVSAGRFYPADPGLLLAQVEACYQHPLGPGEVPLSHSSLTGRAKGKPPLALISPHGALGHSGPIAAHAYGLLASWATSESRSPPGLVVLLGPDHLARGAAVSATRLSYATPLGVVPTDEGLVQRLCDQAETQGFTRYLADVPAGHREEHSLENQIPFIQHLAWRGRGLAGALSSPPQCIFRLPALLPITMAAQDLATAEALARLLDVVLPKEDVILLVTSDMSHCGPLYRNLPRSQGADASDTINWCKEQRGLAVEAIESMDAACMVDTYNVQRLSMCGVGCVATAILFAHRRGAVAARVLAASDSVEVAAQWRGHVPLDSVGNVISPWDRLCAVDPQNPVGFAAIALV